MAATPIHDLRELAGSDDESLDSSDEGCQSATAYFRQEVCERRAAREHDLIGKLGDSDALKETPEQDFFLNIASPSARAQKKEMSADSSDDMEELDTMTERKSFVLRPDKERRYFWDLYMLLLIMYVATISVFVFSFLGPVGFSNPFFWIERFIDISFAIDIGLNFITAYETPGGLVMDPNLIAQKYLRTWFVPDLLSTIPWDLIAILADSEPGRQALYLPPRYLRLLRVFKLARLAHVLRLKQAVTILEVRFRIKYAYLRSVSLVVLVALISHWFACLFYFFGTISEGLGNWIVDPDIPKDLYGQYIAALYFSVYTITTIGFGDVTPVNTVERTYTTIIMLVGAACFAFIISQVSNLAAELSASSQEHRQRLDTLADVARYRNLDTDLVIEARRYLQRNCLRQRVVHEKCLLDEMPSDLQGRMQQAIYGQKTSNSRLLGSLSPRQLGTVYAKMESDLAGPYELLYGMNETSDYMYIVLRGKVDVYDLRDGHEEKGPGAVFGENEILFGQRRRGWARCGHKYCEFLKIPREAVISVLERHRRLYKELRRREGMYLWREAIQHAEQHVRYWKMARKLRERVMQKVVQKGDLPKLKMRLLGDWRGTDWRFEEVFGEDNTGRGTLPQSLMNWVDSSIGGSETSNDVANDTGKGQCGMLAPHHSGSLREMVMASVNNAGSEPALMSIQRTLDLIAERLVTIEARLDAKDQ